MKLNCLSTPENSFKFTLSSVIFIHTYLDSKHKQSIIYKSGIKTGLTILNILQFFLEIFLKTNANLSTKRRFLRPGNTKNEKHRRQGTLMPRVHEMQILSAPFKYYSTRFIQEDNLNIK